MISQAEDLMDRCNRDDKDKNLLLSKKNKNTHRTVVKKDYGAVRGHVVETNLVPLKDELLGLKKAEFATLGQQIHSRRNSVDYETFDTFKEDMNAVVFVETVFAKENQIEDCFFACNCVRAKAESDVKGKICCHVVVAMIEAGM